ncbi:MAG TPA: hypothetical protein VIA80_13985 [Hyphomonadaceae bacterium]
MKSHVLIAALALCACTPGAETASTPAEPAAPPATPAQPADLKALEIAHDWANEAGEKLNADFGDGAAAILGKLSREDAMKAISEAGYECIYGEAHQDYPDPMAVCSRSFATRACQMDWEISSTADKGMVDEVMASFKRDCVGTDKDWPDAVESPIDNQLAPARPGQ